MVRLVVLKDFVLDPQLVQPCSSGVPSSPGKAMACAVPCHLAALTCQADGRLVVSKLFVAEFTINLVIDASQRLGQISVYYWF